jgi:hypothetical protein
MEKVFCPSCGNHTLLKTSVGLNAKGETVIYLKKNFTYRNRGTVVSLLYLFSFPADPSVFHPESKGRSNTGYYSQGRSKRVSEKD